MFTLRRVVTSLVVVAAIVTMGIGFSMVRTPEDEPVQQADSAVLALYPPRGELDLRQATIGFQLDPAYDGRLELDGVVIPDDEIRRVVGLNQFLFQPGPGTTTGALSPGRHEATAVFWPATEGESGARRLSWTFSVH
jgi:hypothetical protein